MWIVDRFVRVFLFLILVAKVSFASTATARHCLALPSEYTVPMGDCRSAVSRRRSSTAISSSSRYQLQPFFDTYDCFGEWYEVQHDTLKEVSPERKKQRLQQDEPDIFSERIQKRLERCIRSTIDSVPESAQLEVAETPSELPQPCFTRLQKSGDTKTLLDLKVRGVAVDMAFVHSDGIIETLEGKKIGVNRALVSTFSQMLRRAFYGHSLEATEGHVVLLRHTHRTLVAFLASIMHRCKDGDFKKGWFRRELDLALDMFDLAVFLQAPKIINVIARNLVDSACPLTYVLVAHRIGKQHKEAYEILWKKVEAFTYQIIKNNTYRLLNPPEFQRLLKGRPNISKHEEVEALKGWCRHKKKERGLVESSQMLVDMNTEVSDSLSSSTSLGSNLDDLTDSTGAPFFTQPQNRVPYSVLAVLGGWAAEGPTSQAEVFDSYEERWLEPADHLLGLPTPRSYHEVVPDDARKKLYVIGGFDGENYYEGSCVYDLGRKKWEDNSHAFMNEKRCYVSACRLDQNHIIAVGGYNNRTRLHSTEILNTEMNLWSPGARMNFIRSDCHVALHSDKVYAIGGFDGHSCHQTVEWYDSEANKWSNLGRKMKMKRSGVCGISTHGILIAVGGFTGRIRLSTAEYVDPREGVWHNLPPMNSSRSNFGISELRDQIYVAGGYDGNGTTTRCERFDLRACKWTELPELTVRRSALSMCYLEGDCVCTEMVQGRTRT
ncbi:unnamed protein product [Bursaphelenchus okinawaensis]|uniref:BTB domain-containing protein n=1 Tax=Bursaphelenchus okinawaensis TaxID=465554 RepID=A0A811JSS5_9BILA|nr:unnamed protein product [Bursaphelenchus okinawaensis]CAG9081388.1 unnamed protein product [Bursaphelenchus okinawaensis]